MTGALARALRWPRLVAGVIALTLAVIALDRLFPPPLERAETLSQWVTDREGRPLRAFPTAEGRWRFPADLDEIDPLFVEALLAVEDKRFHDHWGVDWIAMLRAAWTSARAGRIVSGGSTLTMQTARLLEPRERTIGSKLVEMIRAHQIEARLSKREILELYLTLAPYGGNLEGVRAASWSWFGHEPGRLADDEIALLIALPQSPEMRRPDRRPEGARAGRAKITAKLVEAGLLDAGRAGEAVDAALPRERHAFPARAWHASAEARRRAGPGDVRTSLDGALQGELERIASRRAGELGPQVQLAMMVIDIPERAVRAAVGSAGRGRPGGWIDLTDRPRSPGSTLKPFIYAMAFDDGLAAPATLISDLPKRFDAYQPENFDRSFRGDVTIAEALQHSLNVPAVLALAQVGPNRFASQLALVGAAPRVQGAAESDTGLAVALGGAGLTMRELGLLYAALGDGGRARPLVWQADKETAGPDGGPRRLMGRESAEKVLQILREAPAPSGRMPGQLTAEAPQIAFKTGTSYGFRDAWAAGVAGDLAIIVWVGRADGAPRPGETGRSTALPVLFEVADRAAHHLSHAGASGSRIASPRRTGAREALERFSDTGAPPEILFPPQNAELWAGRVDGRAPRAFVLAGRGQGRLSWYIDGVPCPLDDAGAPVWTPREAGYYRITAVDALGRETSVRVRVIGAPPA
ncbi:MAG: penicillin-binding protein 1C [Alphaproteobacteria bacterium]|jgi:penicillin-binding protein 1C|nr:penicillin-binding protein 1C [Alphaproteobacteria bacterium]